MSTTAPGDGTVGKALEILDAVAAVGRPVRFSELLANSPYPKATLYRLLRTLTKQNMLDYDPRAGTYGLGIRLVRLAHAAWTHASLAPIARPHLEALASRCGESIHLAQYDEGHILFVDKLKVTNRFETLAQVGKAAPAYCTAVGKAMLAFMEPKRLQIAVQQQSFYRFTPHTHAGPETLLAELEDIRRDGIAFDRQEHEQGIISIAAPVLSTSGRVLGAMSIATSTTRHTLDGLLAFRTDLVETAAKIGVEATSWQFPT